VVAMLALIALFEGTDYYLDTALVLALLSFVVTLAAALYRGERKIL
jgi:multisubunit Na+/H+ antiporter MnhF subunit